MFLQMFLFFNKRCMFCICGLFYKKNYVKSYHMLCNNHLTNSKSNRKDIKIYPDILKYKLSMFYIVYINYQLNINKKWPYQYTNFHCLIDYFVLNLSRFKTRLHISYQHTHYITILSPKLKLLSGNHFPL